MATDLEAQNAAREGQTVPAEPSSSGRTDGPSPPSLAAAVVLDKLASLDVTRKAERDRRREESKAAADPRESVARFLAGFAARQRVIEQAIQCMLLSQQNTQQQQQQPLLPQQGHQQRPQTQQPSLEQQSAPCGDGIPDGAGPTCASPAPADAESTAPAPLDVSAATPELVQSSLELLSAEVGSLERSAAAASYYLPPYDQKQCAATVAALRAAIEGARAALAPRRRFAFGSKKVNKVRGEEVSAAAATTTTTTAATALTAASCAPAASPPAASAANPATGTGVLPTPSTSAPLPGAARPALEPGSSATTPPGPTPGPSANGWAAGGTNTGAPSATPGAEPSAVDAPPPLTQDLSWVSEQDRALVARGRGLMGLADARIVIPEERVSDGGAGGDFVLLGLQRCTVVLLGRLRALRLAGLRGCRVVAGPVTGATFVDDVRESALCLATYQVRIHRTAATELFLRVRSKPIIEHSSGVRVAPWAAAVAADSRLQELLQAHMLGEETGCWQQVDDFGWIKSVQSPNWSLLPQQDLPREPMQVPEAVWELPPPPPQAGSAAAAAVAAAAATVTPTAADPGGVTGGEQVAGQGQGTASHDSVLDEDEI